MDSNVSALIEKNLAEINEYLLDVEKATGRHIHLVGATKTRTAEEINFAVDCGLKIVGENRAQEFRDKLPLVSDLAEKHFIGHLQANKIKYVVGKASLIHSCDSVELAREVSLYASRLGVVQDMLIEVNIAGEESKHGFLKDELLSSVSLLKSLSNVRFRGLMTVLPHDLRAKSCAEAMKRLYDRLNGELANFDILSMGMSEDYKIAIRHGGNMIRLGRAIFGERRTL